MCRRPIHAALCQRQAHAGAWRLGPRASSNLSPNLGDGNREKKRGQTGRKGEPRTAQMGECHPKTPRRQGDENATARQSSLGSLQSLIDIRLDIGDIFQTDGQADVIRRDTGCFLFVGA